MRILDKPLSDIKFTDERDALKLHEYRMCVTNDVGELIQQLGFAVDRLNLLAYSRYLGLKEREADEAGTTKEHTEVNPNK